MCHVWPGGVCQLVPVYRADESDETGGELRDPVVRPHRKVELFDRQTVSILILHQSVYVKQPSNQIRTQEFKSKNGGLQDGPERL